MSMDEQVTYTVTLHHEDDSLWAEVDQLPGCFAAGDTLEELWECLTEAITLYLSTPASPVDVKMEGSRVLETSETVETRVMVAAG